MNEHSGRYSWKKSKNDKLMDRIIALIKSGYTIKEVADTLGIKESKVRSLTGIEESGRF